MYKLTVQTHFDAAHQLDGYMGKCSRLHGHRWDVEVEFEGRQLDSQNMMVDFVLAKQLIDKCVDQLDHFYLNAQLKEAHPTAEFVARWLYKKLSGKLKHVRDVPINHQLLGAVARGVRITSVTVWESPKCGVKYYGGEE